MPRPEDAFNKNFASLFDEVSELDATPLSDIISSSKERYHDFEFYTEGGLKKIYRCQDRKTGREVAMASLKDELSDARKESFFREARLSASLQHPNIVPVYDIGIKDESPWFTMKFISGQSLDELLQKNPPLIEKLDIFLKICDAIAYAHSRGVIHLDLKPDNIRISDYGDVVVVDWGLGQIMASDCDEELLECYSFNSHDLDTMTIDGNIKGTPGYMAPEQTSIVKEKKGVHTDIFSMGCILYTLLTDKKPFTGNDLEHLIKNTAECNFPKPSARRTDLEIPAPLEAVCLKAMSSKPEDRYQSVTKLQKEILNYRDGFATSAENASLFKIFKLWFKRHKALAIASSFALIVSFAAIFAGMNNLKLAELNALQLAEKLRIEKEYAVKINKDAAPRFLERAKFALQTFNFKDAMNFSSSAVELDPSLKEAWHIKAEIHFNSQEFNAALKAFSHATANPDLIKICQKYSEIKPQDSVKLTNDNYLMLFEECIKYKLKPQVAGLLHSKAFSEIDIDERIAFCVGVMKIHNKIESLHFDFNKKTKHLDISNNPHLDTALAIQNFPCKSIDLSHTAISNFICFRSQPTEILKVSHTNVLELHSLSLDQLRELDISHTSVPNISRLHGSELEVLNISHTNVRDLDFIKEMSQLKKLTVHQGQYNKRQLNEATKGIEVIIVP
ncbi:protein kinase [Lentisphaera marina]|uniref:protein kinase domain-containing protein n=1 Tax=Lentisphaera marina TaxID=1111041 RepID=UPI00236676C3|nr:protein kinase [Lentisphaera marina]MDD7984036.1 protein kinase [Lentisphaera marina]